MNAGRSGAEGALSDGVTRSYVNSAHGASLWTEMVGNGPPLLTIGGIGSGAFADAPIAGMLARQVTVPGFDRRGPGRSTCIEAGDLDILQQAGDALSVLDGHGIARATVFGACAGAAIALELLALAPHRVERLVIHEPLLPMLLSDPREAIRYESYRDLSRRTSPVEAMGVFLAEHGLPFPETFQKSFARNGRYVVEHELAPLLRYVPDSARFARYRNRIIVMVGRDSQAHDQAYARSAAALADSIGSPFVSVPGHHSAYFTEPEQFAAALLELVLGKHDFKVPFTRGDA
jgi:pimeloyl-ACP methyl ester carboxylesterase